MQTSDLSGCLKTSTPRNTKHRFLKIGIYPLDPNIFPKEAIATDRATDKDVIYGSKDVVTKVLRS